MQHTYDYVESVQSLENGDIRVVAVLPSGCYAEILDLTELLIHHARFLCTRSRVSHALHGDKFNLINEKLARLKSIT